MPGPLHLSSAPQACPCWFSSKGGRGPLAFQLDPRGPPWGSPKTTGLFPGRFLIWIEFDAVMTCKLPPNDFLQSVVQTGVSKMCSQQRVFKLKLESLIPGFSVSRITSLPINSSCNNTVSCSKLGSQSSKEIGAIRAIERKTKWVQPLASNSLFNK